jgi:hypothetical protein
MSWWAKALSDLCLVFLPRPEGGGKAKTSQTLKPRSGQAEPRRYKAKSLAKNGRMRINHAYYILR